MHIQEFEQSLDDYVALGNDNTAAFLKSDLPMVSAPREFHDFFPRTLWGGEMAMSPTQFFLSMNAFMLYTSAVRVALSGHVAATFPLFRTALESACYAYLMGEDDSLEAIWSNRHASPQADKACRGKFTGAVKATAASIERSGNASPGTEKWFNDCYQGAIDFGAHPNPRSVYRHIQEPVDGGEHWLISLTGLHDTESSEAHTSLMACLDYGLVIAVVLLHGQRESESTPAAIAELQRLSDLKNHLAEKCFVKR
jgi:hypothetical protein